MRVSCTLRSSLLSRLLVLVLVLLIGSGLLSGCSKSSDPAPAATDFAGNYKGKIVVVTKSGNQTFTQTLDKITTTVKPGSGANAFTVQLIDDQYGEISDPLKTTVSGNAITLPKQKTPGYPDSEYEGSGTLSGKTLTMTVTVRYSDGTSEVDTITGTKP